MHISSFLIKEPTKINFVLRLFETIIFMAFQPRNKKLILNKTFVIRIILAATIFVSLVCRRLLIGRIKSLTTVQPEYHINTFNELALRDEVDIIADTHLGKHIHWLSNGDYPELIKIAKRVKISKNSATMLKIMPKVAMGEKVVIGIRLFTKLLLKSFEMLPLAMGDDERYPFIFMVFPINKSSPSYKKIYKMLV
jgi:hypothetical protein